MKHTLTFVAVLCAVCHLCAAEFSGKQLIDLRKSGKYAELETAALDMRSGAQRAEQKRDIVYYVVFARQQLGRYADTAAGLKDVDALAASLGLQDSDDLIQAVKLILMSTRGEDAAAVEISASWTGPRTRYRRAVSLARLQRYAEASAAFAASGHDNGFTAGALYAIRAKLPVKVYEYSLAAFAAGKVKDPATAVKLVNAVIDSDYTGTAVTTAKVKEFLQTVNRKYSKKLVVNAPSKWDELIQLVRQTLETY